MPFDPKDYSDSKGKLIKYAWPGVYPVFYVNKDGSVLCPACAQKERKSLVAGGANWEDPDLYCDECSNRIESAYAEKD